MVIMTNDRHRTPNGEVPLPSVPQNAPVPSYNLTVPQAAERIGLSVRTIKYLIKEGRLTAFRFGRKVLISNTVVDEFIEIMRREGRAK